MMKIRNHMRLSDKTLNLLKNFCTINQSILFRKGNKLRTISVMKNILAEAEIPEDLPKDFGVYELNKFLTLMSLCQTPEIDFANSGHLLIKDGNRTSKFFFADPNVIVTPPEKDIEFPAADVSFDLSTSDLETLLKAAGVIDAPDLSAIGDGSVIKLVVRDKKNPTSNDFSIVAGETDKTFTCNFKVENIKILPGNYTVTISSKLLSLFSSTKQNLKYYIALEPDSTFE